MYFKKVDSYLDQANFGPTWLKVKRVAKEVEKRIKQYDNNLYRLLSYAILSNHFHAVLDTSIQVEKLPEGVFPNAENYVQLGKFMGWIKGGSAYEANQILNRTGRFWQPESYDHLVRNEKEYFNVIRYTVQNAEKAGLVKCWRDHPFTYLHPEFEGIL